MLLAAKLVLVATMVALALVNRYVLAPRLKADGPARRALMQSCVAEVVLGAAVVALVSLFGLLDPKSPFSVRRSPRARRCARGQRGDKGQGFPMAGGNAPSAVSRPHRPSGPLSRGRHINC